MEVIDIKKYFEKVKKVFQSKKSFQKLLSKVNSSKLENAIRLTLTSRQ